MCVCVCGCVCVCVCVCAYLYDSEQVVTIQTDPEEVPPIMPREEEAAQRKNKNGKEAGKDQVNIETQTAGE